jgi:hypothetical protein
VSRPPTWAQARKASTKLGHPAPHPRRVTSAASGSLGALDSKPVRFWIWRETPPPRRDSSPASTGRNQAGSGAESMSVENLTFQPSHADNCLAGQLKWRDAPPGMPSELAVEFMAKLRARSTVRKLTSGDKKTGPALVTRCRFKQHCELNPEWALEAWRIPRRTLASEKSRTFKQWRYHGRQSPGRYSANAGCARRFKVQR